MLLFLFLFALLKGAQFTLQFQHVRYKIFPFIHDKIENILYIIKL